MEVNINVVLPGDGGRLKEYEENISRIHAEIIIKRLNALPRWERDALFHMIIDKLNKKQAVEDLKNNLPQGPKTTSI